MRALSDRERRTIRIAAFFVAIYVPVAVGPAAWRALRAIESERDGLQLEITRLTTAIHREIGKERRAVRLRGELRVDLKKLEAETLLAEARAAIRAAAKKSGVGLGPSRETPAASRRSELAVIHLEGGGSVSSVVRFLHALPAVGYPLTIERLTLQPNAKKPGQMAFRMSVTILDVASWKKEKPVA